MNIVERRARIAERRAQQRAQSAVITGPDHPIIAGRPFDPSKADTLQARANARRLSDYHRRRAGQAEPRLQLYRG